MLDLQKICKNRTKISLIFSPANVNILLPHLHFHVCVGMSSFFPPLVLFESKSWTQWENEYILLNDHSQNKEINIDIVL